jgi:hypothetical protein
MFMSAEEGVILVSDGVDTVDCFISVMAKLHFKT